VSCSQHCRGIQAWSIVGYIHPSIHLSDDHRIIQSENHRYAPYCEMKEEESGFADWQLLLAASRSTPFAQWRATSSQTLDCVLHINLRCFKNVALPVNLSQVKGFH
jgi:hypothetical protein